MTDFVHFFLAHFVLNNTKFLLGCSMSTFELISVHLPLFFRKWKIVPFLTTVHYWFILTI